MDENYLAHHGVKGMKWGVRKSRPSSGSRSGSTKKKSPSKFSNIKVKRKEKAAEKVKAKEAKQKEKAELAAKKKDLRKPVKQMSDEELKRRIARLEMEKKYSELKLQTGLVNGQRGKKLVTNILEKSGEELGTQVVKYFGAKAINKALGEEGVFANNKKK